MNDPSAAGNLASHAFFDGAYRRILIAIAAASVVVAAAAAWRFGARAAAGVLVGAALTFVNFLWLKQSVIALTDRVAAQGKASARAGLQLRFFLRYAILAALAYVILHSSAISAAGFMVGLLLLVPAILAEAVMEAWHSLRSEP